MAILRVSDITGELIKDGSGAVLRIEFADSSRGAIEIDVSDEEVDRVLTTLGPLDPSTRRNGKAKAYTVAEKRQEHPRAYERWTAEEERHLRELVRRGLLPNAIAAELGRDVGAIRSRLSRLAPEQARV